MNIVPPSGRNQSTSSRMAEAEKTIQEIRKQNEDEMFNLQNQHLYEYLKNNTELQAKLKKMSLDNAKFLNDEKQRLEEKYADLARRGILSLKEAQLKVEKEVYERAKSYNLQETQDFIKDRLKAKKLEHIENQKNIKAAYELTKKLDKKASIKTKIEDKLKYTKEKIKDSIDYMKEGLGLSDESKAQQQEIMDNAPTKIEGYKERLEANPNDIEAQVKTHLNDTINKFVTDLKNTFEAGIKEYSSYQSKVNARLQGSGQSWNGSALGLGKNGISENLMTNIGLNGFVKFSKLLENAADAVDKGIAFNIEQRAFLETIKDDIASTFDAFNSNLLRIIRLQQGDSTAARLGLEANLTQLFNSYFSDTSYLSDAFDNVSSSLTEAIAQMGTKEGVAFEYQVQKWLGSLYSVGFSESALSNIASAIGQLGSGDVSGLANNSQMQNLIVMAANKAGLSYAEMLTEGLNADETNKLLASMVSYLQEIANSDNKVIKSQYAQLFGLTASDLVAAKNLGDGALSLAQDSLNYSGAINELYSQMNQLYSRLSIGELTGNMIDNVKYTISAGIADNPVTYAL